jgi:hypothetical protein
MPFDDDAIPVVDARDAAEAAGRHAAVEGGALRFSFTGKGGRRW